MLNPVINSSEYNRQVKRLTSQSAVECRFPQSSEITEVTALNAQISLLSAEPSSGRVNYSGKLIITVVYCDEAGKLCRMQKGAEFSHFADDEQLAPANACSCRLKCERLTVRREGSSFVITAIVTAEISVFGMASRSVLVAAEGAHVKTGAVTFPTEVNFSGSTEVEDDFEADSVADVLMTSATPLVYSAVCTSGEVELSGEIYLSLFALRQQTPVGMDRVIPFKCTLPCDDAVSGACASFSAEISDLLVTATVNEERGKCSVNCNCNLSFTGSIIEETEQEAAADAFSETHEISVHRAEEVYSTFLGIKQYSERVKGIAITKARLTYDCTFLALVAPAADCAYNAASGALEGALTATLVYSKEGEIKSTEISLPVSVPLNGVLKEGQAADCTVAASGLAVKLKAEGELEAEATLKIAAQVRESRTAAYLTSIEEGEEIEESDYAVSVFLPEEGDGLWEVSKKLKKSPQTVAACNRELKFPLTGKERILIYRSKKA